MKRRFFAAPLLLALACCGSVALAHDPGLSSARLYAKDHKLHVEIAFNNEDLAGLVSADTDGDGMLATRELTAARQVLVSFVNSAFRLSVDGEDGSLLALDTTLAENDDVVLQLVFSLPTGEELCWQAPGLADLPRGHRQFTVLWNQDGVLCGESLLHSGASTVRWPLGQTASAGGFSLGVRFFGLGVEHILIGYDHILFLLALLLIGGSVVRAAAVITTFTVAHSVTLALASLNLFLLPGALVEAVIAASIVFVGAENLLRKEPRHRLLTTFGFGLMHGFGFASVLRDLGLAEVGGVAVPLLSFNLGVEVGQVAIAAVVLPVLWWLGKRVSYRRVVVRPVSLLVLLAGLWWLVERTV